ncbi:MAG TPA: NAD(P)/FAD-dependent oxidoreductase [Microlunatus sp.]
MDRYDVIIIGGGAAGLSAALVLTRTRRSIAVVDAGAPRNGPATHLHGYLSRDGMAPTGLLRAGRREVQGYGGTLIAGTVTEVGLDGPGFTALLDGGQQISARQMVVTTGLRDELPDIPGLRSRWARDVLHCPYCHGYEVSGCQLGVLGGTPGSVRYAQIVRQWSDDLVYFTPPDVLTATERSELRARAIGIVEGTVDELVIDSDDRLRGLRMRDGCVIPRVALFVPPRFVPNSHLLVDLGCDADSSGWVQVDSAGRTSVPGVWAAGNIVDPRAQVITAAGAGSATAIALNADLVDVDVRNAVHRHALVR